MTPHIHIRRLTALFAATAVALMAVAGASAGTSSSYDPWAVVLVHQNQAVCERPVPVLVGHRDDELRERFEPRRLVEPARVPRLEAEIAHERRDDLLRAGIVAADEHGRPAGMLRCLLEDGLEDGV